MEHIPQSEIDAKLVEFVQQCPDPDEVARRLARFVEARLFVQATADLRQLEAKLSKAVAKLEKAHEPATR